MNGTQARKDVYHTFMHWIKRIENVGCRSNGGVSEEVCMTGERSNIFGL